MAPDPLSLAWCLDPLRESLEASGAALDRQLASADPEDASHRQAARAGLRHVVGALELIGLAGPIELARAALGLLDDVESGRLPLGGELVGRLQRAFGALIDFAQAELEEGPQDAQSLFPHYRSLLEARQTERINAADLFFPVRPSPMPVGEGAALSDLAPAEVAAAHAAFEKGLLLLMRQSGTQGIDQMVPALAVLAGARALAGAQAQDWQVARAYVEALAQGQLEIGVDAKRVLARFNLQLRKSVLAGQPLAWDLIRDMLFGLSGIGSPVGRVAEVHAAWGFAERRASLVGGHGAAPRPEARVLQAALKAVGHARHELEQFTQGFSAHSAGVGAALDDLRDIARSLPYESLDFLSGALAEVRRAVGSGEQRLDEALALEVATALLLISEALESGRVLEILSPEAAELMAQRVRAVLAERRVSQTPPVPALLRRARRAQERRSVSALIAECRASLTRVETMLESVWKGQGLETELEAALVCLKQVGGALTLMGHAQQADAIEAVRTELRQGLESGGLSELARERIADALVSLGHFVDVLHVLPVAAELPAADVVTGFDEPIVDELLDVPTVTLEIEPDDGGGARELLEVFLGEAREVLGDIGHGLATLSQESAERECLLSVRRGFHTLKGSGRLVGLTALGDVAWAIEDLLNAWLSAQRPCNGSLHALLIEVHESMLAWIADLTIDPGRFDDRECASLAETIRTFASNAQDVPVPVADAAPDVVRIGDREVGRALYEIFLGEADDLLESLQQGLRNWRALPAEGPGEAALRAAHSLGGSAALVGLEEVRELSHRLEAILRLGADAHREPLGADLSVLERSLERLQAMLHQFAAGRMPKAETDILEELVGLAQRWQPAPTVVDAYDDALVPVFLEEAGDGLTGVGETLRAWQRDLDDPEAAHALMRLLHTLKGSARMAGAMTLGQKLHELETRIESLVQAGRVRDPDVEALIAAHDQAVALFDRVRAHRAAQDRVTSTESGPVVSPAQGLDSARDPASTAAGASPSFVRVRADLLDRLVNEAGEVSIARSRLDNELTGLRQALSDLTENVHRLRSQLREIEIQSETRIEAGDAASAAGTREFDPLEFDRYTRFQELTRMLAETVNDVATVQQGASRSLEGASADLHRQHQVLRDLQQDLMRVRMVQFGSISDRLYRTVRQSARELDKRVHLDIRGAEVEVDRGVLERMSGPIEHLLRNAVSHGIERTSARLGAGKAETGELVVEVHQEGREVVLGFSDDGAGLDLEAIRARAEARGLLAEDAHPSPRELADFIFMPGFTTAKAVSEISGRGVGMDVVRSEVALLGGRIETESRAGEGTHFTIRLPLTLAVAQVVLVSAGSRRFAVPSSAVEQALQLRPPALAQAYAQRSVEWQGQRVPLFHLGRLVESRDLKPLTQHLSPVLIVRSGHQRIALHCDELSRNQEVIVKNVGPQVARVRGVSGATVLGNGEIALILNPVVLAQALAGEVLDRFIETPVAGAEMPAPLPPVVMVVDDSLTVRKVTARLLEREGYDVLLARDGVDALRLLEDTLPDVMLLDIEMPRMDGFDLTRHLRADPRTRDIPIVMITSRIGDKHRDYALSLGVSAYLGKPWDEAQLLEQVAAQCRRRAGSSL